MKIANYDTNLTDAQWAYLQPMLPQPAKHGRPPIDRRRIINAILYLVKCGCPWRYLPADFPQAGVKRVVHLSSIGAHTDKGNGLLRFHYNAENILKTLPSDVVIAFMRPVGFYYNMFGFINTIKTQGVIASNYGGDAVKPWVSPFDIAAAVAEEIVTPFSGRKVRYVASDELRCNEVASILGAAIGKPDLKWVVISDEQLKSGLAAAGMNPTIAVGFVEMNASIRSGELFEDYYHNKPALGKIKVKDFAKEFAAVFNQK